MTVIMSVTCTGDEDELIDCRHERGQECGEFDDAYVICQGSLLSSLKTTMQLLLYCTLNLVILVSDTNAVIESDCVDGDVRIVDGPNVREGRVEVCINRAWGTVCDDLWSLGDAQVVCLQQRFSDRGEFLHVLIIIHLYVCVY